MVVQKEKTGCKFPEGWKTVAIGEIAEVVGGGTPSSKVDEYWGGSIPWLTPKDLSGYDFRRVKSGKRNITDSGLANSSARLLPKNTVLVTSRAPIGYVALADNEIATNQGFKSLILNDGYDPDFFCYLIKYNVPTLEAVSSGTTFKEISGKAFKQIKFNVPPLPEQKAIAHILGSLDDKIELNRRMNETLEAMAQALFKSWFMDFDPVIDNALAAGNEIPDELKEKACLRRSLGRQAAIRQGLDDERKSLPDDIRRLFPSEFVYTEEMGWIPKGWKVSKVGQEVEITGGGTPNKKDESFWSEGANAFCTPKDMSVSPSTILLKTQFQLTDKGVSKVSSGQLPPGAVLISSRAPIGYLIITNIPVTINQGIIAMLKQEKFSELFLLCWAKCSMNAILSRANGSTFLEINKKNFRTIPFLVSSKDILTTFNNLTNEFIVRITSCSKETQSLQFFRDSLLSKLLAGEIHIQKTDKPLEKLK